LAALSPTLLPPTLPYPEWLNPFVLPRATQLVATGAVALRAGGIPALLLCVGYEVALVLTQVPNRIALCERLPQPDPSLPCGFAAIATSTWPTWAALATGVIGSRRFLPSPTPGTNTLLRAAGVFTFALAIVGIAWRLGQGALFNGLAAVGWLGPSDHCSTDLEDYCSSSCAATR
jgi:hypothetical protein